jgi:hypothetical protein
VNNDPVNWVDPWGLSASDGGSTLRDDAYNKYFLIVAINMPGKDKIQSAISPAKKIENDNSLFRIDAGHAFATLVHFDLENERIYRDSFGLYPASGGIMMGQNVPGDVRDDSESYTDVKYSISITQDGYQSALEFGRESKYNPPEYNLYSYNCSNFVGDLAKLAGVNIPTGGYFGFFSNPTSMQVSIRAMEFWGLLNK